KSFALFPLRDVYFHSSSWVNNVFRHGDIGNVYIYSGVAFLLLFIACVNYLMLSLGRASLRTREVGVRKVFGARPTDFLRQTLMEATCVTLLSLPFALILVELLLKELTGLFGTTISEAYFHSWEYPLAFALLTTLVGLTAGTYVSLYLSQFNPVEILKSRRAAGSRKAVQRRLLMVSQMIIFLGLTLGSLAIFKQLRLIQDSDIGFDRNQLVLFYPEDEKFGDTYEIFKNEMLQRPDIINISGAMFLPMTESQAVFQSPRKDHPEEKVTIEGLMADRDIVETMGMKLVAGVSFRNHSPGAPGEYCLINETAAREIGLSDPVGAHVGSSTVIGVVRDFNMRSFHSRIGPVQITERTQYINEVAARIAPGDIQGTTRWIAEKGARFNKGKPLEFESFEDRMGDPYRNERRFARSIGYATGLAIFVACLGIFGMSVFVCQQCVKEIGIRKVLGATTFDLYYTLTREFVILIFLSSVAAVPLASYLANRWLGQFAYRIDITVWDIFLALIVDIVVVLGTVSYQTLKAASVNPAVSLRYE
ncbi:MAG TPA: FtsX-like permease family protein, partial [Bacteroidota bacterium]|nr:FtsX-like permease family protein [Bacteroidota bacterium]